MEAMELESLIKGSLDEFYQRRLKALTKLNLKDVLKRKNPYLYRAIGYQRASELVEGLLQAPISASDETIFGDAFFEPLVRKCSMGKVSESEGTDVSIETENRYTVISVKSGPNPFNSSQAKRQEDEFKTLQRRLLKVHKQFDPVLGSCYGQVNAAPTAKRSYRKIAGQALWEELTGDAEFYVKLVRLIQDYSVSHRIEFEKEFTKAVKRFTDEFLDNFRTEDYEIDWEKLVRFNSGKEKMNWITSPKP